jgi:hypothetical protein
MKYMIIICVIAIISLFFAETYFTSSNHNARADIAISVARTQIAKELALPDAASTNYRQPIILDSGASVYLSGRGVAIYQKNFKRQLPVIDKVEFEYIGSVLRTCRYGTLNCFATDKILVIGSRNTQLLY